MAEKSPLLLPVPRQMTQEAESVTLPADALIVASSKLLFEAQMIQRALAEKRRHWAIVASSSTDNVGLTLTIDEAMEHKQGYRLSVARSGITVRGADAAGVFYGVCTLRQLLAQYGTELPVMVIEDWPDFPARGVMLDVSRDKVPTMETLYALVDRLASWKVNQLQLYIEHTFAFQEHEEVWAQASPFTGQDILELDAFCRQRHIDLVPNQNSLGHMERFLKFENYVHMAEKPEGFTAPWGEWRSPSTLDPRDPNSIKFIAGLYDELLPHYTSSLFNVGCDEPWELGQGKSKEAIEKEGGRVYLNFLLKLHELVTAHGRQMQFWGDIIKHYPDLVPELPKDITVMEWGYDMTHDFDGNGEILAESGIPFYLCPGTSSWNTASGRTDNAIGNLHSAAENGLKHGAVGLLNTDWGDWGHWQTLPVSYLGFAVGAATAWAYEANKDLDVPAVLDAYAFEDRAGVMGKLAYDLGNIYKLTGPEHINGDTLLYILKMDQAGVQSILNGEHPFIRDVDFSEANLKAIISRIDEIMAPLADSDMARPDAALIQAEFTQAANLLKHGARWAMLAQGMGDVSAREQLADLDALLPQQRATWLARNRRGGLEDSMRRFEPLRNDYLRMMDEQS